MRNYPQQLARNTEPVLDLDITRLLLAFRTPRVADNLSSSLQRLDLQLEDGGEYGKGVLRGGGINHTDRRFWVRTTDGRAIDDQFFDAIEEAFDEDLDWVGPVYQVPRTPGLAGFLCPLPDALLVRTRQLHLTAVSSRLAQLALREDPEKSRYLTGYSYYVVGDPKAAPSHQLRLQLIEDEVLSAAEAVHENMPMVTPLTMVANDELYGYQWGMPRIRAGAPFGQTDVRSGWDIHLGSSDVTICVLDSGCDLTHPDLKFSGPGLRLPLDLLSAVDGGGPNPTAAGFGVGHGTACAGIAAATTNNLKGIAGVAGNCTVLPLAFRNSTDVEVAHGISYAIGRAKVINMSFVSYAWDASVINPSIDAAYQNNVIMCGATGGAPGSSGGVLVYPSTHPHVIACGASDPNDNVAEFSNFGTGLSVVAPGIDVLTTDIQGDGGYNPGSDYTFFTGTSAAAPHVAGLAALLLSLNRTLSSAEVRDIIESTADKVGPFPYTPDPFGNPNKSWNIYYGHGRINVLRALDKALTRAAQLTERHDPGVRTPSADVDGQRTTDSRLHMARLRVGLRAHEEALARLETATATHRILLSLGHNSELLSLVEDLYQGRELRENLGRDLDAVLGARGIVLPTGVTLRVVAEPVLALRAEFSVNGRTFFVQWDSGSGFSSVAELRQQPAET
jgi:hypothetical protein